LIGKYEGKSAPGKPKRTWGIKGFKEIKEKVWTGFIRIRK
jgi:hypothetical protein